VTATRALAKSRPAQVPCRPRHHAHVHVSSAHVAVVKAASPALDVIGAYVTLRRSGRVYVGPCPWHSSRSKKSFQVTPEFNSWRCWACNFGGDVVDFIRRYFSATFSEAVALLARRANIDISRPLPEALVKKIETRDELVEVQAILDGAVKAALRQASIYFDALRGLRRAVQRRLHSLYAGAAPRWADEFELNYDALGALISQIRQADAAYCILAFGERDVRERFAVLPSSRNDMVQMAIEAGFVVDDHGARHQVVAA
jgi:hypothetical protein